MTRLALPFILLFVATTTFAADVKVTIDTDKSEIHWVGKKLTGQHDGTLKIKSGEVLLKDGKPFSGTFEIDFNTVVVSDITDQKKNSDLVGHLKSDDFFSAATYPSVRFNAKSFSPIEAAKITDPNFQVSGDLVIKGITNELTFPASIEIRDGKATADASTSLDRTKWNVRYNSGTFFPNIGDKMIYDNFDVSIHLEGKVAVTDTPVVSAR